MTSPLLSSSLGQTVIPPALSGNINGVLLNSSSNPLTAMSLTNAMAALTPSTSATPTPTSLMTSSALGAPTSSGSLLSPSLGLATTPSTPAKSLVTPLTSPNSSLAASSVTPAATTTTVGGTVPAATTSTTTGTTAATAATQQSDIMSQVVNLVVSLVAMMIKELVNKIPSGTASTAAALPKASTGLAATPTASTPVAAPAAPAANTQVSADLDRLIVGGNAQQKAQLKQNLMAIANDPEGGKLLNESIRKGVTFAVGNPAAVIGLADQTGFDVVSCNCPEHQAAAADAAFAKENGGNAGNAGNSAGLSGNVVVRGVTTTQNGRSAITVADANNLKTLVHEMVHAVSTGDGNSKSEEGIANVVGKRVESRLSGIALEDPTKTFNDTLPNYKELNQNNNIRQTLASLGITAGI